MREVLSDGAFDMPMASPTYRDAIIDLFDSALFGLPETIARRKQGPDGCGGSRKHDAQGASDALVERDGRSQCPGP